MQTQGRCGLLPRKSLASLGEKLKNEMGSNRIYPATATVPSTMQTHSPSGSSNPQMSSSIKTEPSTELDVAMTVRCRSENWAESYQDLSSWCSATLVSSPVICPSPVTDEAFVSDIDFQGEIDFDLRKSEEIASIPLEEDCSFNLWGSASPLLGDASAPPPPVLADSSAEKPKSVLLKDCWWSDIERGKVVKELESSRQGTLTSETSLIKNNFETSSTTIVKEEVTDTKENMNPVRAPQPLTSDPVKMTDLLSKLGITRSNHPGISTKEKDSDLLRILQDQITASNKKKYRSPAAISDLHNYSKVLPGPSDVTDMRIQPPNSQALVTSVPVMLGSNDFSFQSDPFDGLFPMSIDQAHEPSSVVAPQVSSHNIGSQQVFPQNVVAAPAFVTNSFHPSINKPTSESNIENHTLGGRDLFFEAHHEIMKESTRPQQHMSQHPSQSQQARMQVSDQSFTSHGQSSRSTSNITNPSFNPFPAVMATPAAAVKKENSLSVQMPLSQFTMTDFDLNFDSLFCGSPSMSNKVSSISTPEVLKPLVETPTEGFDLLSYVCDDKMNTPPVSLDSNPFHFPQPSSSHSIVTTTTSTSERKPNIMRVRPLTPLKLTGTSSIVKTEQMDGDDSPVVVEVKPQIMPNPLLDGEAEQEGNLILQGGVAKSVKEEQSSPRPSRSSRKRKYSDDEFVLSPSSSEENLKSSRRRTTSSKYDSDEEFTIPARKARKKSVSTIVEEEEDDVKPRKTKGSSSGRRAERTLSATSDTDRYRELRDRNNEASRKSRLTRKAREQELGKQADAYTKQNRMLKVKVEEMENLVKKLREALMQSMMKKS